MEQREMASAPGSPERKAGEAFHKRFRAEQLDRSFPAERKTPRECRLNPVWAKVLAEYNGHGDTADDYLKFKLSVDGCRIVWDVTVPENDFAWGESVIV